MNPPKNIVYTYPHPSTFILRDIEILGRNNSVIPFEFSVKNKWFTPFQFIRQFLFLLATIRKTDVFICHFSGYASFLPTVFGRIFNKPCFIIVAGTDASRFPDFNYGNFTKKLLGYFTGKSLQLATHILPVHESLVYQKYDYYKGGMPEQGYTAFFPKSKSTPFTPVYYGYDRSFFQPDKTLERIENSFVTIGNLNDRYAFKRKGFDLIIELARLQPHLKFTFVGWDGKKNIDLPSNVDLLKYMPVKEVVKVFSRHQYYFQLSIMEGFPNALAEAMLCGCIPIGSNVSGIPYIIGDTGFILHQRNLHELNQLIETALNIPDKDQLSKNARERIANNFSLENRLYELQKIINTTLSIDSN